MIQDVLNRYILQSAQEVQFRLGHRTTFKKNREWIEADSESLSLTEWEDLKDLCLRPDEKIYLETKGHIRGVFNSPAGSWSFSFVEWKENLKAYFSYISKSTNLNHIQNPTYLEALKNKKGIHLISGFKQSGKSTLLRELIDDLRKDSPQQIAVHSYPSILTQGLDENIFQLSQDSMAWENTHPFYDGIEIMIADFNDVTDWNKWIHFAEAGKKVFVTLTASSIENSLLQIKAQLVNKPETWLRFIHQLTTVMNQKIVGAQESSIHEILVIKSIGEILSIADIMQKNHFQSYNQSIIQAIVRRRFDVKTAFAESNNPEELDQQLKKMGL